MFVYNFSLFITSVLLINSDLVWSKRGCASFGHSCFGGHGKRSQDVDAPNQLMLDTSPEMSQQYSHKSDPLLAEQLPRMFDNLGKPTDVRTLLQKLVKLYEEDQRIRQKYMSAYFNF